LQNSTTKTPRRFKHHYSTFCQPEFWLDEPRTTPEIHDLDLQLTASKMGSFAEGWQLAQKIEKDEPNNHRAALTVGGIYCVKARYRKATS
jgi:hypothetical protein